MANDDLVKRLASLDATLAELRVAWPFSRKKRDQREQKKIDFWEHKRRVRRKEQEDRRRYRQHLKETQRREQEDQKVDVLRVYKSLLDPAMIAKLNGLQVVIHEYLQSNKYEERLEEVQRVKRQRKEKQQKEEEERAKAEKPGLFRRKKSQPVEDTRKTRETIVVDREEGLTEEELQEKVQFDAPEETQEIAQWFAFCLDIIWKKDWNYKRKVRVFKVFGPLIKAIYEAEKANIDLIYVSQFTDFERYLEKLHLIETQEKIGDKNVLDPESIRRSDPEEERDRESEIEFYHGSTFSGESPKTLSLEELEALERSKMETQKKMESNPFIQQVAAD